MDTLCYSSVELLPHHDSRQLLRHFVEVKVIDNESATRIVALTTDFSDFGLGLLAITPLPVGAQVEISENGKLIAIGEVINIFQWEIYDLTRMGIKIFSWY